MPTLWSSTNLAQWRSALASYDKVIASQEIEKLPDRDRWYRTELPGLIAARRPRHVTLPELVKLVEWKMTRGKFRARNLVLVKRNSAESVKGASTAGLSLVPHPTAPISKVAELEGVGPATASAVVSAAEPGLYPFFDELVAEQIPGLGPVAFTLGYYARYAEQIRARAKRLGGRWTPVMVERALWANSGGKVGG
ncbi:MAG: hypothetical protein ABI742_12090 [Gemmatimonadota bacterium]